MKRRKFFQIFSSVISAPLFLTGHLFSRGYKTQALLKGSLTVKNMHKNGAEKQLRYVVIENHIYLPLEEFAEINDYGIFTNNARKKSVLYVGREKAKFTAQNSFVILNEQIYQYLYEPQWIEGHLWAPAVIIADLFNKYTAHKMEFDADKKLFLIGKTDVNIANVKISTKDNGTLIHVLSEKQFGEKDISLKVANGWLHVDVYGGKADAEVINRQSGAGVISEIEAIQFDQLVSLAFKLKGKIISRELLLKPNESDFYVSLRVDDKIDNDDDKEAREDLENQKREWLIDTIVIDPGHGGKDSGAPGYGNLREKDIVLPVSLKLGEILNQKLPDVKIVYTRKTDIFIPLWKRTKIANENNGKLFISLHCNAVDDRRARGFETYFLSADKDTKARDVVLQENASIRFEGKEDRKRYEGINFVLATMAQNAFIKQSQYLASVVQKSMARVMKPMGMADRGVKQGPFWVMVGATMPNILVEMGFISNKYESRLLKRKSNQTRVAEAIADGIIKYKNDIESAI